MIALPYESTAERESETRLFAGFALQPFVAFGVGFALFPLVEFVNRIYHRGQSGDLWDAAFAFGAGAAGAAFFVTIFGALPAVMWALRRGPITLRRALGSGALLGNLPLIAILVLEVIASAVRSQGSPPSMRGGLGAGGFLPLGGLFTLALGAAFGMAGAAVFWLVAVRPRGTD